MLGVLINMKTMELLEGNILSIRSMVTQELYTLVLIMRWI